MTPTRDQESQSHIECVHCLERLDARWQPPLYAGMEGYYLLTCVNPRCDLRGYTFSGNEYPPENLFRYTAGERIAVAS